MEAIASGLPCVVSKIRGNTDLVMDINGGFLCNLAECYGLANAIGSLCSNVLICAELANLIRRKLTNLMLRGLKKR